jgi:anti-sigma B factor antagonist
MNFTQTKTDTAYTFTLSGALIGEKDGMGLIEAFDNALADGARQFVLDIAELSHTNSSGLGVLITLHTKAKKAEGSVALKSPNAFLQNLLKITKLNTVFEILP